MLKKPFIMLVAAVVACVAFSACTPKQSQLTIDDLNQKASIAGKVTYDRGIKWNSGVIDSYSDWLPADGVVVVARVPYSSIGGSSAKGNYEVETTTDSKGKYMLEIPMGVSSMSVSVTVRPFYQKKSVLDNEGKEAFVDEALYNNISSGSVTLNPGDIKTVNITVSSSANYGD